MAKKKYADSATMYTLIDNLKTELVDAKKRVSGIEKMYNADKLSEIQKQRFIAIGTDIIKSIYPLWR